MQQIHAKYNFRLASSTRPALGFTIVELLVVIVVIGILAAITIVAYTGITSRATIAGMQSELSNNSNILKLDQVTNGDFPTSLAIANNGKGITPSASLDDYKYTADNISNPKDFCFMYRKGADTYAVDNNSTPSKGACLVNLVSNGDFSNGTSGWTGIDAIVGGIAEKTATVQYQNIGLNLSSPTSLRNHVIYMLGLIKADSTQVTFTMSDGVTNTSTYHPGNNTFTLLSLIKTISGSANGVYIRVQDNRPSGWTKYFADNILAIDLTATFGASNELTKAQMDTIMSSYPNSWLNIVKKANL